MTFLRKLRMWVLPTMGYAVLRLLGASLRLRTMNSESVDLRWGERKNIIMAFWHGRQVMIPFAYGGRRVVILISAHRDGELIARILGWFGFGAVRGSTTRGGILALRQLVRAGREGADLVVTPDGPRGPRCRAQAGVIELAKLTGLPIFPITFAASKKKIFASWDQFEVPLPFSDGCFIWGEPIWVSSTSDRDQIEAKRMQLETALNTLTDEADRLVSAAPGSGRVFDVLGRLMFGAYNIALTVASPVILGILLSKQRCRRGLPQRLGFLPQTLAQNRHNGPTIWVHAVSMGEVNAVVPLVEQLKVRDPRCHVVVSTVTETGKETVMRRLEGLAEHLYFPLDFPFSVRKVMAKIRPSIILIVETELWPNFLKTAVIRGVPSVLVNGRLSTDSFAGYMRLRPFFSRVVKCFSLCLMQSDRDVERIVALGADPERVVRIGNLKFDQKPFRLSAQLIGLGLEPHEELFVAGSTHPQEEKAVLACYRQLIDIAPGLVLLLAPRHIERAQALESTIRAQGFAVVRRMSLDREPATVKGPRVILLDTRGELGALYAQAALVFVGGSLEPVGGHSPLEPASAGKAVVFGPHMDHFAEVAELLVSQGGAIQVQDSQELTAALGGLLKDRARLQQMGRAAEEVVRSQQGTVARTAELIADLLKSSRRS